MNLKGTIHNFTQVLQQLTSDEHYSEVCIFSMCENNSQYTVSACVKQIYVIKKKILELTILEILPN